MKTKSLTICAVILLLVTTSSGFAGLPVVPGFSVEVYAEAESLYPVRLCFGPDGEMYAGWNNPASPGGSGQISRIAPGGGPGSVTSYGPSIKDPDSVAYDTNGAISGVPGAVITGGSPSHLTAIKPDGTAQVLWSSPFRNPTDIVFDSSGRMLFADASYPGVFVTMGQQPVLLFQSRNYDTNIIVVDEDDNIYINDGQYESGGVEVNILAYDKNGILLGTVLHIPFNIRPDAPFAFGPGGPWGSALYAIANCELLRVDLPSDPVTIGTGFAHELLGDMIFGPDGAMYVSSCFENRILRITPSNEAPIADAGPDRTIEQDSYAGASVTLDGSASSDPDGDTLTYLWTWDGESASCVSPMIILPPGTTTITLVVNDGTLDSQPDTVDITVEDTIPPEIFIYEPIPYGLYPTGSLILDFSAYDLVSGNIEPPALSGKLTDADGFWTVFPGDIPSAGVYTLLVSAVDEAGNESDETVLFVVYDPSGGFVTGGGWIWSEPGYYKPDPTLEGKANFGFVSKYKKGATVPTGNTEFVFQAGDLNFHSSSYDWLVVTGSNYARFKGSGTINSSGDYKFMLWAGDDEPDTFRIKIWEEDELENELVIYDNGMDQPIEGGSIIVHTK